jgi:HD superfamily phosphohydrolase
MLKPLLTRLRVSLKFPLKRTDLLLPDEMEIDHDNREIESLEKEVTESPENLEREEIESLENPEKVEIENHENPEKEVTESPENPERDELLERTEDPERIDLEKERRNELPERIETRRSGLETTKTLLMMQRSEPTIENPELDEIPRRTRREEPVLATGDLTPTPRRNWPPLSKRRLK